MSIEHDQIGRVFSQVTDSDIDVGGDSTLTTLSYIKNRSSSVAKMTGLVTTDTSAGLATDSIVQIEGKHEARLNGGSWVNVDTGLNGWVTFDTTTHRFRYRLINKVVYFEGLIKSGTTTNGVAIFAIPAPYRSSNWVYKTLYNAGFGTGTFNPSAIAIDPSDGTIYGYNFNATHTSMCFEYSI